MRLMFVAVWMVLMTSAGLPCQADWFRVEAPCGFSAEFPGEPRERVVPSSLPSGTYPAKTYEERSKYGVFRIRCQVLPDGLRATVKETEWFRFLGDFYQSQAGSELTSETELEIGSFPARKLRFENSADQNVYNFLIVLGDRVVYTVAAARQNGDGALAVRSEEVAARFLASFSVGDVSADFLATAESPSPPADDEELLSAEEEYERGVREGWQNLSTFRDYWTGAGGAAWWILFSSLILMLSGPSLLEKGEAGRVKAYFFLCLTPITIGLVYIPYYRAEVRDVVNSVFGDLPAARVQYYIGLGAPESMAALVIGSGAAFLCVLYGWFLHLRFSRIRSTVVEEKAGMADGDLDPTASSPDEFGD